MLWNKLLEQIKSASVNVNPEVLDRPFIYIDSRHQLLSVVTASEDPDLFYPVSTSRHGLGQKKGSYQTPVGIHQIVKKIGDHEPLGCVFKDQLATKELCLPDEFDGQADVITSRILRLQGLEPGLNLGGDVDSFQRYIYIHGTADENHIGQPASIGCIRMKNNDVIDLFDLVMVNDLVVIV